MWSALDAEQELLRRSKKHLVKQLAELRAEEEDICCKLRKSGDSNGSGPSSAAASSTMLPLRAPLLPTSHRLLWRPTAALDDYDDDDDDEEEEEEEFGSDEVDDQSVRLRQLVARERQRAEQQPQPQQRQQLEAAEAEEDNDESAGEDEGEQAVQNAVAGAVAQDDVLLSRLGIEASSRWTSADAAPSWVGCKLRCST